MSRKPTLIDRMMAEVVVIGGFPITRHDAFRVAKAAGYTARERDWMQAHARLAAPGTEAWSFEEVLPYLAPGAQQVAA